MASQSPAPPGSAPPSLEDVEAVFLALSHEARRHVVLLLGHLGGELPSGYLAAHFQHSWPTTTRHLKVLEQAGIVEVRREGRGSHYRLNRDRLRMVVGGWLMITKRSPVLIVCGAVLFIGPLVLMFTSPLD